MSLAGLTTFEKNLRTLMDSEGFREGDDHTKLTLGYRLLNSAYGLNLFGKTKPLPEKT
jgi:hypothetical protein